MGCNPNYVLSEKEYLDRTSHTTTRETLQGEKKNFNAGEKENFDAMGERVFHLWKSIRGAKEGGD